MNPVQLAEKFVDMGRRTGKTTELVNSLPDEKCAVMTHDYAMHRYIKELIQKHRPDYNVNNITWLVYSPGSGWRDKTLLRDMHVYIDNAVLDYVMIHQVKGINDVYGKQKS